MKERIKHVRSEIERHDKLYFADNKPEITDHQYDALFNKLLKLEQKYPEFADPNSPSARVGNDLNNKFPTLNHPFQMPSIKSCFSSTSTELEMEKHQGPFYISCKFDGIAVELHYNKKGELTLALSRGNGTAGADITTNVRTIADIPKKVGTTADGFIVRGEIFLSFKEFKRLNKIRKKQKLERYTNLRNAAASLVKAKQSSQTAAAKLSAAFFYYYHPGPAKTQLPTALQLSMLQDLHFNVPYTTFRNEKNEAIQAASKIAEKEYPYPVDGAVIKTDYVDIKENTRYQIGAWAIKTNSPIWETHLRFVAWNVSSKGKITPVAHFEPFDEAGSTFSKASLVNIHHIKKLNLHENAKIQVQISGFTTPQIIAATGGDQTINLPEICPDCHQPPIHNRCENSIWCPAFGFDAKTVNERKNFKIAMELPASVTDGPGIFKTAALNFNALVVRKSKQKQKYILLTDSLKTLSQIGLKVGELSTGPHIFEEQTAQELHNQGKDAFCETNNNFI